MRQEWIERPEGGTPFGYKLITGFALAFGRTAARLVLYPITLYFLIRRGPERRASRQYLERIGTRRKDRRSLSAEELVRTPTLLQVARHIHCFAAVTLDRVFLLSERFKRFDIRIFGLEELQHCWDQRTGQQQRGLLLFGSHLGSFDVLRVFAQVRPDIKVRVVIDTDQNPTLSRILNGFNPALAASIINPRQDGVATALAIKEALDERTLVTLLADRARPGNQVATVEFLGHPAPLPTAPWQLAAALGVPVMLCFGLYRGGNRYDLHFEKFLEPVAVERSQREALLREAMQRYADRLAHHARNAPYNWFNFYDFWL